MTVRLFLGDCIDILPTIESESADAVITDTPYPHIKRDYGTWTTEEWWALIVEGVIPEVRRILKPTGSAVFILQPNSEHVGQMRGWLFEFQAWVCCEWNMIQDVYWWNRQAPPTIHARREYGLMRPSVRHSVWCGDPDCFRDQSQILLPLTARTKRNAGEDGDLSYRVSGHHWREGRACAAAVERGGSTPFNMIAGANGSSQDLIEKGNHGAGTPFALADWWVRYICPPGGTVLDPFDGVGTMMLAALQNGCNGIGIERDEGYHEIAQARIEEAQSEMVQTAFA